MAVILPNVQLAVRKKAHPFTRDAHGTTISDPTDTPLGVYRAAALIERADTGVDQGVEWGVRLEPEEWPVEIGDTITDGTRVWVVTAARLHEVVGVPDVDYVAVTSVLEVPKVP